jgi:hypothetical protein
MSENTVEHIVRRYLADNGYDGLYNANAGCGCLVGDLAPCDEISVACVAGYKRDCPADCGDHDWHVGPAKA